MQLSVFMWTGVSNTLWSERGISLGEGGAGRRLKPSGETQARLHLYRKGMKEREDIEIEMYIFLDVFLMSKQLQRWLMAIEPSDSRRASAECPHTHP